jgi:hypothetical protein
MGSCVFKMKCAVVVGSGEKVMTCFGWILTNLTAGVMGFDLLQNETVLLGIHRGKGFFFS